MILDPQMFFTYLKLVYKSGKYFVTCYLSQQSVIVRGFLYQLPFQNGGGM